jgi:hypothetical protein
MPARRALTVHRPDHAHALAAVARAQQSEVISPPELGFGSGRGGLKRLPLARAPVQVRTPQGEIMKLCGWKTRAMFDRYNIIDEIDLAQAVAKRFNGKVTAKSSTPAPDGASLSCSPASSAA